MIYGYNKFDYSDRITIRSVVIKIIYFFMREPSTDINPGYAS